MAFRKELGSSLSVAQAAAVERAAALCALAEDTRTRRLAGDTSVSLEDLVRLDSACDRAVRRLGIRPGAATRSKTPGELFDEHMARLAPGSAGGESR